MRKKQYNPPHTPPHPSKWIDSSSARGPSHPLKHTSSSPTRAAGGRGIRKGLSVCGGGGGGRGGGGGGSGKGEGRGDLKNAGEKLKNVHFYLVNA